MMISYALSQLLVVAACLYGMYAQRKTSLDTIKPYMIIALGFLAITMAIGAVRFGFGLTQVETLFHIHRLFVAAIVTITLPFVAIAVSGWLGHTWQSGKVRMYSATAAICWVLYYTSGLGFLLSLFVSAASLFPMIVMGFFAFVVRTRPTGAGMMLLSIFFMLNYVIIGTEGTMFGVDRFHVHHVFMAFWAVAVANLVTEEQPITGTLR